MGLLKGLFQKKESSCCNVKIEEVKEDDKSQDTDKSNTKNGCCS